MQNRNKCVKSLVGPLVAFVSILGTFLLPSVFGLDQLDGAFNPVIRGPGSVRAMAYHPQSGFVYVSVIGDRIDGRMLATSLIRFSSSGVWDSSYAPQIIGSVSAIKVMPDGKIFLAGNLSSFAGHQTSHVARLNPDGTPDTAYTVPSGTNLPDAVGAMDVSPDGTVYLGTNGVVQQQWNGSTWAYTKLRLVFKVAPDGTPAQNFGPVFSFSDSQFSSPQSVNINALLASDTGVIAGGSFTQVAGTDKNYLVKISPTGAVDGTFAPSIVLENQYGFILNPPGVYSLADAGGGKVYVGGVFNSINSCVQQAVARLNPDGSLDPAYRIVFNSPYYMGGTPSISRIVPDALGRVIAMGDFDILEGSTHLSKIVRTDAFGHIETGYAPPFGFSDNAVALPFGYMVFGQQGASAIGGIIQPPIMGISSAGSPDPAFKADLRALREPDFLAPRPGKGPILGGFWVQEIQGRDTCIAALNLDGTLDSSFNPQLACGVKSVLLLPDGRILLGGYFDSAGGAQCPNLGFLEADGRAVSGFTTGTGPDSNVEFMRLLPNQKVFVSGYFSNFNGQSAARAVLLDLKALNNTANPIVLDVVQAKYGANSTWADVTKTVRAALGNGTLTITANNTAMGVNPISDMKSLQVTYLTNLGQKTASVGEGSTLRLPNYPFDTGLVRAVPNAELFISDATGIGNDIYLVGSFTTFAGKNTPSMVKLDSNLAVVPGFRPATYFSWFYPRLVRATADGKLIIGGSSNQLTGQSSFVGVHRLNADGTPDRTFNCPSFIFSTGDILPQSNGKIWVSGSFSSSRAGERSGIACLTNTGAVDSAFDAGAPSDGWVENISLTAPSKLWVTGSFDKFQGVARSGVALVNLASAIPPNIVFPPPAITASEGDSISVPPLPTGENETYDWFRNGVQLPDQNGRTLDFSNASPLGSGNYTLRVSNGGGVTTTSFSIDVAEYSLQQWLAAHGLSSPAKDDDGDGVTNEQEYVTRTDPCSPDSHFKATTIPEGSDLRIQWPTFPGRRYIVEASTDMTVWTPATAQFQGDGNAVEARMALSGNHTFWRVRATKP